VELQISPKRAQVHSAYRLKKFIDPKSSKFLNEEKQKQERAESQKTEFNPGNISQVQKENISNKEIKAQIEQRITGSMTNQLKEKQAAQAIAVINDLIILEIKIKNNRQENLSVNKVNSRGNNVLAFIFQQ
jgi:hypothetical protein